MIIYIIKMVIYKKYGKFLLGASLFLLAGACAPVEEELPSYFTAPTHFPAPIFPGTSNGEVFHLGRALFYDPVLSRDSSISCGSCHAQVHGFADHNTRFSSGVGGALGKRNAPGLANLAWMPHFNWDGGVLHLEIFSVLPITEPVEMDFTIMGILDRLRSQDKYNQYFNRAFGEGGVTETRFFKALAAFLAGLISAESRFDDYLLAGSGFTAEEQHGYTLFMTHCDRCHTGVLTSSFAFEQNFVPSDGTDRGRMRVTGDAQDSGKFRVPSLRNVALTYPYMHQGQIQQLSQVLDHYATPPPAGMGLPISASDKKDLEAFLLTLTDFSFVSNPLFSEP
jgi:cytochrome c peroxidase